MGNEAVVLLSGGLDSTTALAMAIAQGYTPHTLTFDYGQRHKVELEAMRNIIEHYRIRDNRTVKIDLRLFGGSALTDSAIDVPKDQNAEQMAEKIPATYVPARNTIFLSFALAFAEVIKANVIFIGVNQLDYSGYVDCRGEFIRAYEAMANLATKRAVEDGELISIATPLLNLTKAEIIKEGTKLNVPYGLTHSCYDPITVQEEGVGGGLVARHYACGKCDSCILRHKGFEEVGIIDPTSYYKGVK